MKGSVDDGGLGDYMKSQFDEPDQDGVTPDEGQEPIDDVKADDESQDTGDEPTGDEPPTNEPDKDKPDNDELTLLREQNKQLMQLLQNANTAKTKPEPEPEPPDIFDTDTYKSLTDTLQWSDQEANAFKALMQLFAQQQSDKTSKSVLSQLPEYINPVVAKQNQLAEIRSSFYGKHPALSSIRGYVHEVANQLAQTNPNAPLEQILEDAAQMTYKNLGITPRKDSGSGSVRQRPAFPQASGVRKKAPVKSSLQKEIDDMLALDEG